MEIRNNLFKMFIMLTVTLYILGSAMSAYISSYYYLNGLTSLQIGTITSVSVGISIVFQYFTAFISDATNRRKLVMIILVICAIFSGFLYLRANSYIYFMICASFYTVCTAPLIPLADGVMARRCQEKGVNYANVRMSGTIAYALGSYFSGLIIALNPHNIFYLTIIYSFLTLLAIIFIPDDVFKSKEITKSERVGGKIYDDNGAYLIIALTVIGSIGMCLHGTFIGPKVLSLGYGQDTIGLLTFVDCIGEILILLIVPFFRKINPFLLMFVAICAVGLRLVLSSFDSLLFLLLASSLNGLGYILYFYVSTMYLAKHTFEHKISQSQVLLVISENGLGTLIGTMLGGRLVDLFGYNFVARVMAITMVTIALLIVLFINKK